MFSSDFWSSDEYAYINSEKTYKSIHNITCSWGVMKVQTKDNKWFFSEILVILIVKELVDTE